MRFGLLLIGDELLDGKTSDANTKTLGSFLSEKGHKLAHALFCHDDLDAISKSLGVLYQNLGCDVVITSGGLGPTPDDKTKMALAQYFKRDLVEREDVAQLVGEQYRAFGREWNRTTNSYHIFPKNFETLKNPVGLAPGLFYLQQGRAIACAPGVPREFKEMLNASILPKLEANFSFLRKKGERLCVCTFGVPEEKIFFELAPTLWRDISEFAEVASYPRPMGVDIVVRKSENSPDDWKNKAQKIIENSAVAPHIWQIGELELPQYLFLLLKEKNLTIALAESCTGGLAASLITDISGSSKVFKGSYVTYDNELKVSALGVKIETLKSHGAVSTEIAREMSQGTYEKSNVDLALAFTGIAGPDGGSVEKPVGTVAISVTSKFGTHAELFQFKGNREILKLRFALRGFHMVRELLSKF